MDTFRSDVSQKEFPVSERVSAETLRPSVFNVIQKDNPNFSHESYLSKSEATEYVKKTLSDYLVSKIGNLTELEKTALASAASNDTLVDKLKIGDEEKPTFGQRVADKVAAFGGSWTFILSFGGFILVWITINIIWLINKGFDPYPFILLNLILSCLSALQAPVIMMSQNRTEARDRAKAKNNYMINLKTELELKNLNEKIDKFISDRESEHTEMKKSNKEMMDLLNRLQKN